MNDSENSGSNEAAATTAIQPEASPPKTQEFIFHGTGSEYFRIWIVNLLFTILTVGIYSAWAKVRKKRYFYGNTELAGDRFEYLADPIDILKGRLIALVLLLIYYFSGLISLEVSALTFLLLVALIPIIVVQSLRFNTLNSAWRGVRFGFDGKIRQAYPAHLFWPFFGIATLGLGMPYAFYKINQFQYNHYRFGSTRSSSSATAGGFYKIAVAVFFAVLVSIVLMVISIVALEDVVAMFGVEDPDDQLELASMLGVFPIYLITYVFVFSLSQALTYRLVFNNLQVGGNRLGNSINIEYVGVILTNTLLTIVTLGAFYPWAAVRRARYLLSNMRVESRDLESFTASERDHLSARGEEFGEAFDLGIGI